MKVPVYNSTAKKVKDIEIPDDIYGAEVNDKVLAQYIYIYLSNQRQGNANTKTKAEVRGGGKKPFNQKGTGRARAGSIRSPIWVGGGRAHGPTNAVNYTLATTKKFRRSALRSALSKLVSSDKLNVIEKIEINGEKPLTKQALDLMDKFKIEKKTLVVTMDKNEDLLKATDNLKNIKVAVANEVNVYDILNSGKLLIEEAAVEFINNRARK